MNTELVGCLINQRYRVIRAIGEGGMSQVFEAKDTLMFDHTVAIKVLHQDLMGNPQVLEQMRRRFEVEARVGIMLGNHPHITRVLDFGFELTQDHTHSSASENQYERHERPFLVMEYLGERPLVGYSLDSLISKARPMDPERVVNLAIQMGAALHYAHRFESKIGETEIKGVIHRDIKPNNIFIIQDPSLNELGETVKILDFGIVKLMSDFTITLGTQSLGFIGTPQYASPEQVRGEILDPRSDIYSLGTVMYLMLTGVLPIKPEKNSIWAWIQAQNHQQPISLRQFDLPHRVPLALETIVMSCLEKDPESRPQNMLSLCRKLQLVFHRSSALELGQQFEFDQGNREACASPTTEVTITQNAQITEIGQPTF